MSTEEAFIIINGNYDEESDSNHDVIVRFADADLLEFEPPLLICTATDYLKLAEWIGVTREQDDG